MQSRMGRIGIILLLGLMVPCVLRAENWPRFRGPNGTGVSQERGIPATWSPEEIAWTAELPGVGHSSPVVWGRHLFVTSAVDQGALRFVLCLDAATGQIRWTRVLGMNRSHKHVRNSWASSTPTTDGRSVYVTFADEESYLVTAYDFDGKLLWRRSLGRFESQHNLGVSPIIYDGSLIIANDQVGPSFITALDCQTGRTRWRVLRQSRETSYATPMVIRDAEGNEQLICVSGAMGITSLNPHTGRPNWATGEFPLRTVGSPVFGNGLVIASCGQGGRFGVLQIAVDPTLRDGAAPEERIRWTRKKVIPYVPTPIVYGGYLFEWTDQGLAACVDLKTGKDVWRKRIGGNFSGSPVCIDGRLYAINDDGEVVVIAASPEFRLLGRTPLGDPSRATPAVANGRLYLRTYHRLTCIAAPPPETTAARSR
ncbi:MAG: PQQ-binding-like beta-propeller repeat protein [Planctomycetes bacterium]|nr:PQQ-binding-like beta-propeller repeat protein [Planctomycetota bacterium]